MLTNFDILQQDPHDIHRGVWLYCFDGNRMVLVFVTQEAVEDRFARRGLTRQDSRLLVATDLDTIGSTAAAKYAAGNVEAFPTNGGGTMPMVIVTARDVKQIGPVAILSMAPELAAAARGFLGL